MQRAPRGVAEVHLDEVEEVVLGRAAELMRRQCLEDPRVVGVEVHDWEEGPASGERSGGCHFARCPVRPAAAFF